MKAQYSSLLRKFPLSAMAVIASLLGLCANINAATVIISENFGGASTANLAGTSADTFDSAITTAGGSSAWGGSANIKANGDAYGNNAKVVFLNLGTYINDTKGSSNGLFDFTATIGLHTDSTLRKGSGFNFISFHNTASPASGVNTSTVGSIGARALGNQVAYAFQNSMADATIVDTTSGAHTVTISLDLTSSFYNGTTQFGKITLTDSVAGVLGSTVLTSDQSFSAISIMADGSLTSSRTGTQFSALTLTQSTAVPEPSTALLGGLGVLLLLLYRRRCD